MSCDLGGNQGSTKYLLHNMFAGVTLFANIWILQWSFNHVVVVMGHRRLSLGYFYDLSQCFVGQLKKINKIESNE